MSKIMLIASLLLALSGALAPPATAASQTATVCTRYDPQVVATVFAQYRNFDSQVFTAVLSARFGADPQLLAACYGITWP